MKEFAMHDIDAFRTERLLASRITVDDFEDLSRMYQDPAVMATLFGVRTPEETHQYLQSNIDHWTRHGYGLWSMRDPATHRFIGRGGLRNLQVDGVSEVEVSYAVCAEFWRQGFATEMRSEERRVGKECRSRCAREHGERQREDD